MSSVEQLVLHSLKGICVSYYCNASQSIICKIRTDQNIYVLAKLYIDKPVIFRIKQICLCCDDIYDKFIFDISKVGLPVKPLIFQHQDHHNIKQAFFVLKTSTTRTIENSISKSQHHVWYETIETSKVPPSNLHSFNDTFVSANWQVKINSHISGVSNSQNVGIKKYCPINFEIISSDNRCNCGNIKWINHSFMAHTQIGLCSSCQLNFDNDKHIYMVELYGIHHIQDDNCNWTLEPNVHSLITNVSLGNLPIIKERIFTKLTSTSSVDTLYHKAPPEVLYSWAISQEAGLNRKLDGAIYTLHAWNKNHEDKYLVFHTKLVNFSSEFFIDWLEDQNVLKRIVNRSRFSLEETISLTVCLLCDYIVIRSASIHHSELMFSFYQFVTGGNCIIRDRFYEMTRNLTQSSKLNSLKIPTHDNIAVPNSLNAILLYSENRNDYFPFVVSINLEGYSLDKFISCDRADVTLFLQLVNHNIEMDTLANCNGCLKPSSQVSLVMNSNLLSSNTCVIDVPQQNHSPAIQSISCGLMFWNTKHSVVCGNGTRLEYIDFANFFPTIMRTFNISPLSCINFVADHDADACPIPCALKEWHNMCIKLSLGLQTDESICMHIANSNLHRGMAPYLQDLAQLRTYYNAHSNIVLEKACKTYMTAAYGVLGTTCGLGSDIWSNLQAMHFVASLSYSIVKATINTLISKYAVDIVHVMKDGIIFKYSLSENIDLHEIVTHAIKSFGQAALHSKNSDMANDIHVNFKLKHEGTFDTAIFLHINKYVLFNSTSNKMIQKGFISKQCSKFEDIAIRILLWSACHLLQSEYDLRRTFVAQEKDDYGLSSMVVASNEISHDHQAFLFITDILQNSTNNFSPQEQDVLKDFVKWLSPFINSLWDIASYINDIFLWYTCHDVSQHFYDLSQFFIFEHSTSYIHSQPLSQMLFMQHCTVNNTHPLVRSDSANDKYPSFLVRTTWDQLHHILPTKEPTLFTKPTFVPWEMGSAFPVEITPIVQQLRLHNTGLASQDIRRQETATILVDINQPVITPAILAIKRSYVIAFDCYFTHMLSRGILNINTRSNVTDLFTCLMEKYISLHHSHSNCDSMKLLLFTLKQILFDCLMKKVCHCIQDKVDSSYVPHGMHCVTSIPDQLLLSSLQQTIFVRDQTAHELSTNQCNISHLLAQKIGKHLEQLHKCQSFIKERVDTVLKTQMR